MSRLKIIGMVLLAAFVSSRCDTGGSIDAPYDRYFVKYYGGNGDQYGVDMVRVAGEDSILLLGNWQADRAESRIYLVKVDLEGRIGWEKLLGSNQDRAKDIESTGDGNFVILSDVGVGEETDIKLIRIRPDGSKIDSVVYGSQGNENGHSITVLSDNGFIVTGSKEYDSTFVVNPTNPNDLSDIFHYRASGSLVFNKTLWYEQYGPGTNDGGTKVFEESSNQYYVFGYSNQIHQGNPTGNTNLLYYSVDAGGVIQNLNYLGDFDNDTQSAFVLDVPATLGGGFFVASTETTPAGSTNLHVTKLRSPLQFVSASDELFDLSIPMGTRSLSSFSAAPVQVGRQGYLLLANELQNDGTNNIWLTKVDQATGVELWSVTYGVEEEDDRAAAITELSDGRILLLGSMGMINNQSKMVLMKLNSEGRLTE